MPRFTLAAGRRNLGADAGGGRHRGFAEAAIGLALGAHFLLSGDGNARVGLLTTIGPRDALVRDW